MDIQSMKSAAIAMEYSTNVLKKANGFVKQQGEAAMQLINSASAVSDMSGASAGGSAGNGKGGLLDIKA